MLNLNCLKHSDIIFFEQSENRYQTSQLKNYIHFLSYNKIKRPYRFSHIQAESSLLGALTLRENIQLDSNALDIIHERDQELEKKIQKAANPHLEDLMSFIDSLDSYPHQVNNEQRKLTTLIKGLLHNADFLFLEQPELHLSQKSLETFILAMDEKCRRSGQIILLSSPHQHVWSEIATKIVSRHQDKTFHIQSLDTNVTSIESFRQQSQKKHKNVA